MSEFDTFGITLPVRDWKALLDLSRQADRSPSDYLRILIRQELDRVSKLQAGGAALGDDKTQPAVTNEQA